MTTTRNFVFAALLFFVAFALPGYTQASIAATEGTSAATTVATAKPLVRLHTNRGDIVIELWPEKAPETVKNFLRYVDEGFYAGTIFHRVLQNTLIQGGGYTRLMQLKKTHEPIKNESRNRLRHERGTVAMARLQKPNTATAQFFINAKRNAQLDNKGVKSGYAIFGKVIEGMDIVEAIAAQRTGKLGPFDDVPLNLIIIESASRVTPPSP